MSDDILEIDVDSCMGTIDRNNYNLFKPHDRIFANDLQYDIFFKDFMLKNIPCVIKNVCSNWQCSVKWVHENKINYEYIVNEYGDLEAPVADCNEITYNAQRKCAMKLKKYVDYLRSSNKTKLLYLKDWHLKKIRQSDNFYEIPKFFGCDWLNEYAQDKNEDDFRFVYIGPKNSWTPIHADVYSSFSWSVNIFGRKEWILFPPGEELKLKDNLGNLPLIYDAKQFSNIKCFKIIQESGEAIFVPSGWYHQVTNLKDTISINHNWINGCNIALMWKSLKENLASVENEIADLKESPEFCDQCQLILKSVFGIDYEKFLDFVIYIAQKRLQQLEDHTLKSFDRFSLGRNHILFDLYKLNLVFNDINTINFINYNSSLLLLQKICYNLNNTITTLRK